jgi:cobalamin biosynthesis Mg chelatase CobN
VAVEVKKGKPNRTRLVDQINRYAEYEEVKAIVIVVETSLRIPVTQTTNGKPCAVVGLQKLWAFGTPSEGMAKEIEIAKQLNIPVIYYSEAGGRREAQ